jgi:tRNA-splicing ligase RtcB (3'-phosphate/5'-hydroxy nucleic acid ligase)
MSRGQLSKTIAASTRAAQPQRIGAAPQKRQTESGVPYTIYGQGDEVAAQQLENCLNEGSAVAGALMADHHVGYCFPLDTQILTRQGWKSYEQTEVGDETLGLNPATGMTEWTPILEKHFFPEQEVIQIAHSRFSFRATAGHRWWSDKRHWKRNHRVEDFTTTEKINSETRLILSRPFAGGESLITPQEASIIAWILSDGHLQIGPGGGPNKDKGYNGSIFQGKPRGREAIEEALEGVPHAVYVREREGTNYPSAQYRIQSEFLRQLWRKADLEQNSVSQFLLSLSQDSLEAFMEAFELAEGSERDNYMRIPQNRGELHDALALAIYLLGYRPRISRRKGKCGILGLGRPHVFGAFLQKEDVGIENVWCVTTELGTLTAKQANEIVLTGNSQPIGGVVAYEHHISPSGVGYDISCGVKGVKTNLLAEDVDIAAMMDEISSRISFGIGRNNDEPVDHEVIDKIGEADFDGQRELQELAAAQLGTVGSGNHYLNLLVDEDDGTLWISTHFGSRGFGHQTATGFLALAQGKPFSTKERKRQGIKVSEGEMNSPPVLLDTRTDLGQSYIAAMQLAGEYAYAGRDLVCQKALEILGAKPTYQVHEHHNYAWKEIHQGKELWVVRKGATPAQPGQEGVIGGSMGGPTVVVEGQDSPDAIPALYSTVHGAGRVMSRTQAAGKKKWEKVWVCGAKNCNRVIDTKNPKARPGKGSCSKHPKSTPERLKRQRIVRPGKVDFNSVQERLIEKGIHLRGGGADEAPEVYKDLDQVLRAHEGQIRINRRLRPVGVAMAGANVFDPYKD